MAASKASKLKMVIFLGSTREGRLGSRVCKFVTNSLKSDYEYIDVDVLDPLEMNLPMLEKPFHFYRGDDKPPKILAETNEKIKNADAFLLISCEYNHSMPPALLNLLDHFPGSAYSWRPSGLITYSPGQYGGMRAAMQLRAVTGELGCISVSNIFGIPKVHESIDADGKPLNDHMKSGLSKLMTQLEWTARAFKTQRDTVGIPK